LQKLLREVEKLRGELKEEVPKLSDAANNWRYMGTTVGKLGHLNKVFTADVADESDMHKAMMYHIAEQDAIDIYDASAGFGTDEEKMGRVVLGRVRENIELLDEIYQQRYGRTLEDQVRGENKTLLGMMGADSLSHFGRFLSYRCMPQARRDALLIRKCMSGMGCSDFILCEVLSTRTNGDLRAAAEQYAVEFEGEDMVERIKTETGGFGKKWYGKWVDTLVEFDRDESGEVPDNVEELAQQLYDAGAGKWTGCDEQVFIDMLCKANEPTCIAIAEAYANLEKSERTLAEDVEKKMGGDLEFAVLARIRSKLDFLALRLYKACKGWGTDEECICRVLGCIENGEVVALNARYSELYAEEDAPFNEFSTLIESELSGSLLEAMQNLLKSSPPKSHWEPVTTYAPNADADADGFRAHLEENFDVDLAKSFGNDDLHGPLKLINVDSHFICDGYDVDLPCNIDLHQKKDISHLMDSTPDDVEAAEKLVSALKGEINGMQQEEQMLCAAVEGSMAAYYDYSRQLRYQDSQLNQYKVDNVGMLEFCADRDANAVHEAVEGWGTDEGKLIRILCALTKKQLRRVDEIYSERYGKTLRETCDSELGGMFEGNFKYFMKCAITPPAELDAELLRDSMKGFGTSDSLLCEIVCTRTNKELLEAKKVFEANEGKPPEDWVEGDTSGFYTTFLLRCLKADRTEGQADKKLAERQVEMMQNAGLGGGDVEEAVFINILPRASEEQIGLIREAYKEKFGKELTEAIKEAFSGDMEKALLARVHDKLTYYATVLNGAFAGWGTDEKATSRVLGRNMKTDVRRIGERYEEMFGGSLKQAIKGETSGHYQAALLTYIFAEGPAPADEAQVEVPPEDTPAEAAPEEESAAAEEEQVDINGTQVSKTIVLGFLTALGAEYVDESGGAVGQFCENEGLSEEIQASFGEFENVVRDAEDKGASIEEIRTNLGV